MKKIEYIKEVLAKHREELHKLHKVTKIGIFGSYVRGDQKHHSDIDILVELDEPVSLLKLVGLENFLTDILGMKADVVPKKDIRPELKEIILNEVIYL